MKTWKQAWRDALFAGGFAGLASLAALALRGRRENGSGWGPVNAPSHWLWGDAALREDRPSLRYTAIGLIIHQLSAGFWGLLHEGLLGRPEGGKRPAELARDAALTAAIAAAVDFAVVPHRLTPGFQHRLSLPGLVLTYGLFAAGLALGSHLATQRKRR